MDKALELLSSRFVNFFTRSLAPSSVFFVLLFFNDYFFNYQKIYGEIISIFYKLNELDRVLLYFALVLLILSYGYVNQIFSQFLDNLIKKNYELSFLSSFSIYIREYQELREESKKKFDLEYNFESINFNDYNAYQLLGNKIKVSSSYVDNVKAIHSFSIAISLNLIFLCFEILSPWYLGLILIILLVTSILAKSRYMARNKRLYINYLLVKNKKQNNEKELKIKSLKVEIDE